MPILFVALNLPRSIRAWSSLLRMFASPPGGPSSSEPASAFSQQNRHKRIKHAVQRDFAPNCCHFDTLGGTKVLLGSHQLPRHLRRLGFSLLGIVQSAS